MPQNFSTGDIRIPLGIDRVPPPMYWNLHNRVKKRIPQHVG